MEENLKVLKVEYLCNHIDLPQILNLSFGDKTKIENSWKGRGHPMEDDLPILKVEYLSNHWSDLPQILNLSLDVETNI